MVLNPVLSYETDQRFNMWEEGMERRCGFDQFIVQKVVLCVGDKPADLSHGGGS